MTDDVIVRKAKSGLVNTADLVVLHETSRTRVEFVPSFITHNSGSTELSVKILTHKKAPPPMNWVLTESKSITLGEPAARKLLDCLKKHLSISDNTATEGQYISLPVECGAADLTNQAPSTGAAALTRVLGQRDVAAHLANVDLTDELLGAMRSAIRIKEMRVAVAQLRSHLDNDEVSEQVYQTWCEEHSWAFGNAYVMRDDVRDISPGDSLDLLLPTVMSGFRDIVELKRPDMKVLNWDRGHRNYYFSADVAQAIGQCHRYLDVLQDVASRGLRDHPEIFAYHPRAIIVIGRSNDWSKDQQRALHGLNARLAGITVMTYDHLLNQGERLVQMLSARLDDDGQEEITSDFEDPFDN